MYYSVIKHCDIANGPGCRVVLFVSGCTNRCRGCFQPETWDFHYGQPFGSDAEAEVLLALSPAHISGLTLLGGEPFEPENRQALLPLVQKVRQTYPDKTIWAFSGFTYEQLTAGHPSPIETTLSLLGMLDVLVDGKFEEDKKNLSLRFRGSTNQRLIDLNQTREQHEIVLWDDTPKWSMQ